MSNEFARDPANQYAVIHPDTGEILSVIVWDGKQHYSGAVDATDDTPAGCQLVRVTDIADPDPDGKYRLEAGAPAGKLRPDGKGTRKPIGPEHDHAARACCLPTRHEHVHLEIEETLQEAALAKLEGREPDPARVAAAVARHREAITAERTAAMVAAGKPVPPGDARVQEQRVKALVPPELCAVRAMAREAGADEIDAEAALKAAKRDGKQDGELTAIVIETVERGRTKPRAVAQLSAR